MAYPKIIRLFPQYFVNLKRPKSLYRQQIESRKTLRNVRRKEKINFSLTMIFIFHAFTFVHSFPIPYPRIIRFFPPYLINLKRLKSLNRQPGCRKILCYLRKKKKEIRISLTTILILFTLEGKKKERKKNEEFYAN